MVHDEGTHVPEQAPVPKIVIKKIIPTVTPTITPTVTPTPKVISKVTPEVTPTVGSVPATAVCIAVASLRKGGYSDLDNWIQDPKNLYVGRHGRIFITDPVTKDKRIFHYPASKWANPYKVGRDHTLEQSIDLYVKHLNDSRLINDIHELRGKRLGCFCDQSEICHAQVLADLANQ